jgi:hypothetical protein
MNTTTEPDQQYIDGALRRIESGVHHRIARRRNRTVGIVAGAAILLSGSSIAAASFWPAATGPASMECFLKDDISTRVSTGVGFDMRDPVGFCIDSMDYRATISSPRISWLNTPRSDLMACKLADGVAGVFPVAPNGCEAVDLTAWTPADAAQAAQIQGRYNERQQQTFGIPVPTVGTTPHQIPNP